MTNYSNRINRKGRIFYILPLGLIMFFAAGIIRGLFPEEAAAGSISVTELRLESPIKESSATYNQDTSAARILSAGKKNPNTPIYVVDGKRTKDISKLSPDSIESITVLKKDNLIIITTKEPDTVVKEKSLTKKPLLRNQGHTRKVMKGYFTLLTEKRVKTRRPYKPWIPGILNQFLF